MYLFKPSYCLGYDFALCSFLLYPLTSLLPLPQYVQTQVCYASSSCYYMMLSSYVNQPRFVF